MEPFSWNLGNYFVFKPFFPCLPNLAVCLISPSKHPPPCPPCPPFPPPATLHPPDTTLWVRSPDQTVPFPSLDPLESPCKAPSVLETTQANARPPEVGADKGGGARPQRLCTLPTPPCGCGALTKRYLSLPSTHWRVPAKPHLFWRRFSCTHFCTPR